ncbi:MAG: adenylate/guanylate cyclase domain-containing protein, partial [Planctomycetaceae bacterium]|nr:adenylate/guanylate cyclase domain-containing protein [Planctomycetaceae bacterium]
MWQLLADGRDPQQRWKQRLEPGQSYIIGRDSNADFPVPWEPLLSRRHFRLTADDGKFVIHKLPEAKNPVFYAGDVQSEFTIGPGERFVVGQTAFVIREFQALSPRNEAPVEEVSFSNLELQQVQFEDADRRLDALSQLPKVIGEWNESDEKASALAGLILAGIRHAELSAVVRLANAEDVEIAAWDRRTETRGSFRPSLSLVREAVHEQRTILHIWEQAEDQNQDYTLSAEFDWAFCTPFSRADGNPTAIYVAGRMAQPWQQPQQLRQALRSDVRFAQLVVEIVSSSERMNRMEGQVSVLRQFLSPPLLSALEETGREGELNVELLQPRVCDVTVLFCDLRGFSHFAEEAIDDLEGFLAKVNAALEVMTRAILDHGGVTGDFLGDAVLGFWGWPFSSEDSPVKACRAALAIREEFARLKDDATSPLKDFRVGIGVAHGRAVAGKIGTGGRISVTVFGPVVNLA